jgi:Ca2+-binding RTX toxin-like protein
MGADTLSGGSGADVFEFNLTGDATASQAVIFGPIVLDKIVDWSSADFLQFWGATAANGGNYREITAGAYTTALNQAQGAFTEFGVEYTVAQVGGDVIVFAPRHDQAIVLAGRTLDDISLSNLGPTPGLPAPPAPPAPGATPTAGNDSLSATASNPEIHAGAGDDTIQAGAIVTYLRGDDGNDSIMGGSQFDDINGNMGNDTASGGVGDDWVVGGKDSDNLSGDSGSDIVYGNIGADTCDGGEGADIVRGGQDNDIVRGGAGDDFVSGDKGDDTMTGGSGADSFHTFGDAGLDRVVDFSASEGDRVQLDPGTQYTVAQVGGDTVISMTGGGQMVLVGVSMSALPAGWIFGA